VAVFFWTRRNTSRDLTPFSRVSFRMTLSELEWLSEIFNDTRHRAVSLWDKVKSTRNSDRCLLTVRWHSERSASAVSPRSTTDLLTVTARVGWQRSCSTFALLSSSVAVASLRSSLFHSQHCRHQSTSLRQDDGQQDVVCNSWMPTRRLGRHVWSSSVHGAVTAADRGGTAAASAAGSSRYDNGSINTISCRDGLAVCRTLALVVLCRPMCIRLGRPCSRWSSATRRVTLRFTSGAAAEAPNCKIWPDQLQI